MEAEVPGKAVALSLQEENEKMLVGEGVQQDIGRETSSRGRGRWATGYTLEGKGERLEAGIIILPI